LSGTFGNFYVTATDPAGPWSYPIFVDVPEIDPDLFFDDDGLALVISSPFILYEVDLETGKLLTEGRKVWNGTATVDMTCPTLPLKPFPKKQERIEFDPKKENEEAGMTLLNNGSHFLSRSIKRTEKKYCL
jgi:hypothetical protein